MGWSRCDKHLPGIYVYGRAIGESKREKKRTREEVKESLLCGGLA